MLGQPVIMKRLLMLEAQYGERMYQPFDVLCDDPALAFPLAALAQGGFVLLNEEEELIGLSTTGRIIATDLWGAELGIGQSKGGEWITAARGNENNQQGGNGQKMELSERLVAK